MESLHFTAETEPGNIRDPMILRVDGRYYLTGTRPPFWKSPNEGIRLWSSDDLTAWRDEGLLIDSRSLPDDAWAKERFWAPEIHRCKDRFVLAFSCHHPGLHDGAFGVFLAFADRITGPYTIRDAYAPFITGGIDASFHEHGGRLYVSFAQGDVMLCEVDTISWTLLGTPSVAIRRGGAGEWDHDGVEGNFIVEEDGRFLMWYSSWTRGYEIGLVTAERIDGTWHKDPMNPILSYRNGEGSELLCGHASAFTTNEGRKGLAYHVHLLHEPETMRIELHGECDAWEVPRTP